MIQCFQKVQHRFARTRKAKVDATSCVQNGTAVDTNALKKNIIIIKNNMNFKLIFCVISVLKEQLE